MEVLIHFQGTHPKVRWDNNLCPGLAAPKNLDGDVRRSLVDSYPRKFKRARGRVVKASDS